jgi:2-dehydro-3-deoxygluconokinase
LEVDLSKIRIQKNTKSAIGVFMLLFGSKKRPLTFRFMTHDLIPRFTNEDLEYISNSRLLHIGGYLHFPQKKVFEELIRKSVNQGVKISIDTQFPLKPLEKPWLNALPNCLDLVDLLIMDENEAFGLTNAPTVKAAAKKIIDLGVKIVAIKLGAKGCLVCDQNERIRKSAIPVKNIVDSIGAGDSFDCGLVTGFLEGLNLDEMTELALKVASHSLRGLGGSPTIPPRSAL